MIRFVNLLVCVALVGCASPTTRDLIAGETSGVRPDGFGPVAKAIALDPEATPLGGGTPSTGVAAPAATFVEPSLPAGALVADEGLRGNRFTVKGGLYSANADELSDDGWIINLSWMRFFTKIFAIEVELGYLDVGGEDGGVDADVWAVPLMVNGRANLPVWILDVYGGLGVGGFYFDAEAEAGGLTAEDDGFLLGGNAFLGTSVNLADSIAVGLEAKYYVTEDADDFDESLDALAIMLTVGFGR